ncbi:MAG: hypothetical protein KBC16_00940 [Candidatus Pacebacteria bacterium]|nr:hypothetical protein [Candidatus Paceibacterota bacterium]
MKSIAELLLNHPIPGLKEAYVREEIAFVVSETLGISCVPKQIQVKHSAIYIALPPVAKSALLLKHTQFTSALIKKGIDVARVV